MANKLTWKLGSSLLRCCMGATVAFLGLCLFSSWRGNKNSLIFRVRRHLKKNIPKVALFKGIYVGAKEGEKRASRGKLPNSGSQSGCTPTQKAGLAKPQVKKIGHFKNPIRKYSEIFGKIRKMAKCPNPALFGNIRKYSDSESVKIPGASALCWWLIG